MMKNHLTYIEDVNQIPLGLPLHACRTDANGVVLIGVLDRIVYRIVSNVAGLRLGNKYMLTKTGLTDYNTVAPTPVEPVKKTVKINGLGTFYPFGKKRK